MKRSELATVLRQVFKPGREAGVARVEDPRYKHIWFVVPPAPPRQHPAKLQLEALARANRLVAELPRYTTANDLDKMVSYLFVRREAVESSRIEGTFSTIDHVLTPGELYDHNEGRSARASTLGYAQALEHEYAQSVKKGLSIFSIELACRLHREVMSKDPHYKGRAGRVREPGKPGSVVYIGGLRRIEESTYNPTPARYVQRCLREVMSWMADEELAELGDAGMGMTLPVRMAIGHAHFEAVHPFTDGNGRVGRMLLALQMACHGTLPLYLSGYVEAEKTEYGKALAQAQQKLRYGPIVEYVCEAMLAAQREAEQTKSAILSLPARWRERGAFREDSAASRALPSLLTNPIFTVKNLAKTHGVSAPAANRAAAQLVSAGIVRERTGYGRNRVFAAEEVIELLSRRFDDDHALALERARDLLKQRPLS